MTKPDSKNESKPAAKKKAASSTVIETKDVGAGSATTAAAKGGAITPAPSELVGKGDGSVKPAAPKAQTAKTEPIKKDDAVATPMTSAAAAKADDGKPGIGKDAPASPAKDKPAVKDAAPPPQPTRAPVKKTGFWPVVLGGVVAAGLGSAATIWALPHLPAGWLPAQPAASMDSDAIRAEATAAAKAEIEAQAGTLTSGAAEAARAAIDELTPALNAEIESLGSDLQAQAAKIAALEAQPVVSGDAPASPPPAGGADTAALAALQSQLAQQAAQIAQLESRPALDPAVVSQVQELAAQADAVQGQINAAAQAAAELTRRAEAVAAVAALQSALERGGSTDDAVQQLQAAGVDAPPAVQGDVPSLTSLQESFDEAARSGLRTALRSGAPEEDAGGLLGNFLRAQTGARSVTPRAGGDTDAVLSRMGAAVEAGDIGTALVEAATLPEPAQKDPTMAAWIASAAAYQQARSALQELSGDAN